MENQPAESKFLEFANISAVESLDSALRTNIIPNQEYFLQGSILDTGVEVLLHRLRGLCDNVDVGPESFHDHEASFVLMYNVGQTTQPSLALRVRRAMDDPTSAWQLRYLGSPELGDKSRPTMIRTILDISCGSDIVEFLKELGFRRDFDFVTKGYLFRKGRLKITVGKLFRYDSSKAPQDLEPVTGSHYVEMSIVTPGGQDVVGEDMKNLAEQLKPLIVLDKVDFRR